MLQPNDPVLITAYDRLHRVGFVVLIQSGGGPIVQPTEFDGSPLPAAEGRHSVLAAKTIGLRDIPSEREKGGVLLRQSPGGGIFAAQLVAPVSDTEWIAEVGLYVGERVLGDRESIALADWHSVSKIADAIEAHPQTAPPGI